MPRVNYCNIEALGKTTASKPAAQKPQSRAGKKLLEATIIDLFGLSLTLADLCKVLGLRDPKCARNWVSREGIEAVEINGRKRYLATDVAKALDNSKMRTI